MNSAARVDRFLIPLLVLAAILCCDRALAAPPGEGAAKKAPKIETAAGTGDPADGPSRGEGLMTNVGNPFGVEIGPDGGLYIAEVGNQRVRRLDLRSGELTTIAGTGRKGYAGDGGPAEKALINEPYEIRFDSAGDMYFVEMQNHVIRKVSRKTGLIETVAGTGTAGFSGDGGPATDATFRQPHSIALDDEGNIFVADILNHRIRRIDAVKKTISTIAGNGEKVLPREGMLAAGKPILGPRALAWRSGNLWVALREGNSLWRLDFASGKLHHEAGAGASGFRDGGPEEARFAGPKGIAFAPDGSLLIVDTENQAIRRYDPKTRETSTVCGTGPTGRGYNGDGIDPLAAKLNRPHGVCVDAAGVVFIGDSENHRVRRFSLLDELR